MLRVLFVQKELMHHKNMNSILNYKKIEFVYTDMADFYKYNLNSFNCVYSPALPIDVSLYPNTRFIFGPHFSVFPDERLSMIKGQQTSYIILSEWVKNIWCSFEICKGLPLIDNVQFGVDSARFCPNLLQPNRESVFIYFKQRDPTELLYIQNYLNMRGIHYRVFDYINHYSESEYLEYLKHAKYGIWIGRHESQGFALEEALSCNVPLLVWNVSSMRQEYGSNYQDIPATVVPYWDERCGEIFYQGSEFPQLFQQFLEKLPTYSPREYILENLSMDICEQRFIDLINTIA